MNALLQKQKTTNAAKFFGSKSIILRIIESARHEKQTMQQNCLLSRRRRLESTFDVSCPSFCQSPSRPPGEGVSVTVTGHGHGVPACVSGVYVRMYMPVCLCVSVRVHVFLSVSRCVGQTTSTHTHTQNYVPPCSLNCPGGLIGTLII